LVAIFYLSNGSVYTLWNRGIHRFVTRKPCAILGEAFIGCYCSCSAVLRETYSGRNGFAPLALHMLDGNRIRCLWRTAVTNVGSGDPCMLIWGGTTVEEEIGLYVD